MAKPVLYMGVGVTSGEYLMSKADKVLQILRNDPSPAIELAVEKDLSSFSRFTRQKYAPAPRHNAHFQRLTRLYEQLWRVHDNVR